MSIVVTPGMLTFEGPVGEVGVVIVTAPFDVDVWNVAVNVVLEPNNEIVVEVYPDGRGDVFNRVVEYVEAGIIVVFEEIE